MFISCVVLLMWWFIKFILQNLDDVGEIVGNVKEFKSTNFSSSGGGSCVCKS